MAKPIYREQGNQPFRTSDPRSAAKRGQVVPYDINGAPSVSFPSTALAMSIIDLPLADVSEPLLRVRFTTEKIFTGGGLADAEIAATGTPAFVIMKDGLANGDVAFTGTTGTIAISDSTYPAGSLFEIYPPNPVDATLDQVSITLDLA